MAVYNFGSINVDHIYRVPHLVAPGETISSINYQTILGGKGANQSIALARAGVKTFHVGAIGTNDKQFVVQMQSHGVHCEHVATLDEVASGHAIIQVDASAENSILLFGGANQKIKSSQIELALLYAKPDDYLLIQNEINANAEIIEKAKQKGMRVVFNPAPMSDDVKSLPLDSVDLFIVNEIEAEQLTGQSDLTLIKQALLEQFPNSEFVITLGKAGACYLSENDDITSEAFDVDALDTTAAGDTFIGFFLAGLIAKQPIKQTLKKACAASALSVTKVGASSSIPCFEDVEAFLSLQ